jgi:hypothetical protein
MDPEMAGNERKHRGILIKLGNLCRPGRTISDDRGAVAVEFAMGAPVFFAMLFAIFEFGRMFFYQGSLRFAVEQAGRIAMAEYTQYHWCYRKEAKGIKTTTDCSTKYDTDAKLLSEIVSNAAAVLPDYLFLEPTGVKFSVTSDTSGSPDYVQIEGTYNFSFIVPFLPVPDVTLRATTKVPMGKFDVGT